MNHRLGATIHFGVGESRQLLLLGLLALVNPKDINTDLSDSGQIIDRVGRFSHLMRDNLLIWPEYGKLNVQTDRCLGRGTDDQTLFILISPVSVVSCKDMEF